MNAGGAPLSLNAGGRSGTDGAGDYNPLSFRVIGESLPGRPVTGAGKKKIGRRHTD
jgi:hypothetical protein